MVLNQPSELVDLQGLPRKIFRPLRHLKHSAVGPTGRQERNESPFRHCIALQKWVVKVHRQPVSA